MSDAIDGVSDWDAWADGRSGWHVCWTYTIVGWQDTPAPFVVRAVDFSMGFWDTLAELEAVFWPDLFEQWERLHRTWLRLGWSYFMHGHVYYRWVYL